MLCQSLLQICSFGTKLSTSGAVLAWAAASSLEDWQGHQIEVFLYLIYTVFLANPGYRYFLQMKL
jgi:hypothetical protein